VATAVHGGDDVRVPTQAGVEGEPALVHLAEADAASTTVAQRREQGSGRLNGVPGDAQGAREDVGAPTGDDSKIGYVVPGAFLEQPVDHFVDRAVAAQGDDEFEPVAACLPGQLGRVGPVGGLDDLELELALQRRQQHLAGARRRGRGRGVDHQQRPHGS